MCSHLRDGWSNIGFLRSSGKFWSSFSSHACRERWLKPNDTLHGSCDRKMDWKWTQGRGDQGQKKWDLIFKSRKTSKLVLVSRWLHFLESLMIMMMPNAQLMRIVRWSMPLKACLRIIWPAWTLDDKRFILVSLLMVVMLIRNLLIINGILPSVTEVSQSYGGMRFKVPKKG